MRSPPHLAPRPGTAQPCRPSPCGAAPTASYLPCRLPDSGPAGAGAPGSCGGVSGPDSGCCARREHQPAAAVRWSSSTARRRWRRTMRSARSTDGLRLLEQDLKADDVARQRVRILVLRVGAPHDVEVVTDWVDALEFEAPEIEANGHHAAGRGRAPRARRDREREGALPRPRHPLQPPLAVHPHRRRADRLRLAGRGRRMPPCRGIGAGLGLLRRRGRGQHGQARELQPAPAARAEGARLPRILPVAQPQRARRIQVGAERQYQMAAPSDWAVVPGRAG